MTLWRNANIRIWVYNFWILLHLLHLCVYMCVYTYTDIHTYIHRHIYIYTWKGEKANITKFSNFIGETRCWRCDINFTNLTSFLRFKNFQTKKSERKKYQGSSFLQTVKKRKKELMDEDTFSDTVQAAAKRTEWKQGDQSAVGLPQQNGRETREVWIRLEATAMEQTIPYEAPTFWGVGHGVICERWEGKWREHPFEEREGWQ